MVEPTAEQLKAVYAAAKAVAAIRGDWSWIDSSANRVMKDAVEGLRETFTQTEQQQEDTTVTAETRDPLDMTPGKPFIVSTTDTLYVVDRVDVLLCIDDIERRAAEEVMDWLEYLACVVMRHAVGQRYVALKVFGWKPTGTGLDTSTGVVSFTGIRRRDAKPIAWHRGTEPGTYDRT